MTIKLFSIGKMQQDLGGVEYPIIDEFLVIGQQMFAWITGIVSKQLVTLRWCIHNLSYLKLHTRFCITPDQIVTWQLKDTACTKRLRK